MRCWVCKHDMPEAETKCVAGVGTSCVDRDACRARQATPMPGAAIVTCPDGRGPRELNRETPSSGPEPLLADFVHDARHWLATNDVEQTSERVTTLAYALLQAAQFTRKAGEP